MMKSTFLKYMVIHNQQTFLVINRELTVIIRILIQNFGYRCIKVWHIESRKYFSPYLQDRCTILCYKISWPCED